MKKILYTPYLNFFSINQQTDVIYTDFEKVIYKDFDRINYSLLILKLSKVRFFHPVSSWLNSFLTNGTQFVKYKNFFFDPIPVNSGVR